MKVDIVVDTSVFVSALIGPSGASRELIRLCLQDAYQPLVGCALFAEYESVIARPQIVERSPLTSNEILTLLQAFMSTCQWIDTYFRWRPNLKDEADNHLIEIAIAGNARAIVTHNLKDFRNAELLFPRLAILKPEQFLGEFPPWQP